MRRFVVCGAVAGSAVILWVTAAAGVSSSVKATRTMSFVGAYRWHETANGQTSAFHVRIRGDGTATNPDHQVAYWTSSATMITVTFTGPYFSVTFTGERTAKGIGSRRHPGTFVEYIEGGKEVGTWYAVKKT